MRNDSEKIKVKMSGRNMSMLITVQTFSMWLIECGPNGNSGTHLITDDKRIQHLCVREDDDAVLCNEKYLSNSLLQLQKTNSRIDWNNLYDF